MNYILTKDYKTFFYFFGMVCTNELYIRQGLISYLIICTNDYQIYVITWWVCHFNSLLFSLQVQLYGLHTTVDQRTILLQVFYFLKPKFIMKWELVLFTLLKG